MLTNIKENVEFISITVKGWKLQNHPIFYIYGA